MPNYKWEGISRSGQPGAGTMTASSADDVAKLLRRQRIRPTRIEPKRKMMKFSMGKKKPSQQEVAIFTRQFSVMIDAGLPLVQCLDIMTKQSDNKLFAEVLNEIRKEMEGGVTLADAMRKHDKVFSELYCNMVEAGEAGGILDVILRRLATYIEKSVALKATVKSVSIYPGIIVSVAVSVVRIILWKVIPTFAAMFAGLGAQLPLPTRIVVAASNFLAAYFPWVVTSLVGLGFAGRQYYRTDKGERHIDAAILKVPVVGLILRKISVA